MKNVPLGDIATLVRGVSFSKEEGSLLPLDGHLPIIRAGSIQESLLLREGQIWVPADKIKSSQKIRIDDIVMCTSSGSSDLVGKCARSVEDFDGSFGAFCAGIRADQEKASPSYLYHFLCSPVFKNWTSTSSGANIKNIRVSELAEFQIPLPPLPEQKRIAAILDKADAIRRKRQQAIQLADDFLRAVFLDMFGDPVTNPKGWEVKPLGDVIRLSSGNGLSAKEMDSSGCYPVYGGNGINGYHSEYMFEEPQLVIGRVGAYCGAIHITQPCAWVTDNALYIREYIQDVNVHYMAQLLDISNLNQYAGKAAQPLVSGSRIYPLEMIFPPLQQQFKFEAIKTKYLESSKIIGSALLGIETMFSSLVQKAFAGQL